MMRCCRSIFPRRSRRGITLMEVTVSTILVGLVVVGALRCLAGSSGLAAANTQQTMAMLLAEDLMEEILQHDYSDPDGSSAFGPDGGESSTSRAAWDDVDDYHNWTASPAVDADGVSLTDDTWKRTVQVEHVAADDLSDVRTVTDDTGVKKITVTVLKNDASVLELVGLQTTGWISMIPDDVTAVTTGQMPPANQPPIASLVLSSHSGNEQLTVEMDATSSVDPEDAPLEYEWSVDDELVGTTQLFTHTFSNSGSEPREFRVNLTVTDIHGGSDSATSTVTLFPVP